MTRRRRLRVRAWPLLVVVALPTPLLAQDESPKKESGELHGEVVAGPQYYAATDNRDSAKFEEFRDVPNGFVAERLLLSWTPREGWFLDLDAVDVGQDDQRIFAQFGRRDVWRGRIHWVENPRLWTDQAFMLFGRPSDALFTLEDSFQSAVQAAAASSLPAGDADLDGEWDPGTKGFVIKNAIASSASEVFLGHQRERGGVALEFTPTRHWTFGVLAERERREGTTPQSLGMYFSLAPAEVAAPLDFRTDSGGASLEYTSPRFNLGLEVAAARFDNGTDTVTWDNQLFLDDQFINVNQANPGHGRLTFGTDSEWQRIALRGGVNLAGRTRIDALVATNRTTQDDPFVPMTINTLLVPAALPAGSLDGEYRTDTLDVRVTSRPLRNFRWKAWARSYELDNRTPSLLFLDTVVTDYQFPLCGNINLPCDANGNDVLDDRIQRRSLPYGYRRQNAGVEVGWRPVSWFDGSLGYAREAMDREFSAVEESTEDIYKLTLDLDVAAWLGVRSTLRMQERRADDYDAHYLEASFPIGEPTVAPFNEGSRRYYWTDRDRDSWELQFDVTPNERWAFYGEVSGYDDDYFDPLTGQPIGTSFTIQEDRDFDTVPETYDILLAGRTENQGSALALGLSYRTGPNFDLYADYTIEEWEYALASRYRNVSGGVGTDEPADNWSSSADDDYDTASLGFHWTLSADRAWSLNGDLSRSEGTSLIRTEAAPGGASSGNTSLPVFPEVEARLSLATLTLNRIARRNFDYSLRYVFESWKEDNFASDFNQPYMGEPSADPSMANAIFLGIDFKNYTNHIVSALLRYRF